MSAFNTVSLDGRWDFFYSPQPFNNLLSPLPAPEEFSGQMVTPGYWDDHYELFDEEDFFGLTARFNPDYRKPHFPMGRTLLPHAASSFLIGTGFYRKRFTVDQDFCCATLTVGPAMWGCSVYCNGCFAGSTTGYSTASTYQLEKLLKPGENELIIAVCNFHDDGGAYHRLDKSHDGIPFGTRPGQHRGLAAQGYQSERGGINGGVALKLTPQSTLSDYYITFANGVPVWHVENRGGKAMLHWSISYKGEKFDSGTLPIDGRVEFTSQCPPALWSDRHPELCDIELTLDADGQITDAVKFRWGARQLTVNGMSIEINGIPTFFRGVTEHCYFADTTNPHCDREKYLRELGVLQRAGFNFVRCHTWCPPEAFYEACDQLGLLVETELPSVWSFDEAADIIRQIRRHPSAVILCEGNEKKIDETAIIRLEKLAAMLRQMAPGMLFNPQSAMRGIEYDFDAGREITHYPMEYDAQRLDRVREISDCFGNLAGEFSYGHDEYPGRELMEARNAVYQRPCLCHEAGILGGYLDFSLESRYENTFIGTDLFRAAREHMTKHGVYEKARIYYEKNTLFITECRKQLIENIRSMRNVSGFDYLGGIDTHWHLIGYPCGVFNEFYEEKYGETVADVRRYCGESILLCSAGNQRNRPAGTAFSETIEFSCFEEQPLSGAVLQWSFDTADGQVIAAGKHLCDTFAPGKVVPAGAVNFTLPSCEKGVSATLKVTLSTGEKSWENRWNFWIFPAGDFTLDDQVKIVDKLDENLIRFISGGGRVLLTGNFPALASGERFRSFTSGRSLGHGGALLNAHPIWEKFPHNGFLDWQFFPMMTNSKSLIYSGDMPEFAPIFELIPSFKMVKHKSMLSEFTVGKGRLLVSGWRFDADDPGAKYMLRVLVEYLNGNDFAPAPEWPEDKLISGLAIAGIMDKNGKKVDAGGRPVDG
ncbi:MAG: hypothetical protein E7053_02400 [Lentisphaerae bacterium]|nr:hypothetical protein [Lentisphaerota bacterium]